MRTVVTRVLSARVDVSGKTVASIERGLLVLAGVSREDDRRDAMWMADRVCKLRIFEDDGGKMNLPPDAAEAGLLIVPNFTLYGDCTKSRRPGFTDAAGGESAKSLFDLFVSECRKSGLRVETGIFGAEMAVHSVNDGPVTFIIEGR